MAKRASPVSRAPRHLFTAWPEVARRLARAPRLALFADFDGTLTRIRRRASAVRLPARVRRLLALLADRGDLVGIVSGRGLDDLYRRVGLPGLWYVGAHGFLIRTPHPHTMILVSQRQRRLIALVGRQLARAVRHCRGVNVEPKIATVAVHHRNASAAATRAASRAVHAVVARQPALRIASGKKVWEVLPTAPVDKYRAVRFILREARRHRAGVARTPVYVGDDVADEAVFRRLRGVTVSVGRTRGTQAAYFVRSPKEVRELLSRLSREDPWTIRDRRSDSSPRRTSS